MIVTDVENGGYWDHVAPPIGNRWGPGTRVPTIVVSRFARRGFVDHTTYDTTSILKMIEVRRGPAPFGSRDAPANDLTNAFDPVVLAGRGPPRSGGPPSEASVAIGLILLAFGARLRRRAAARKKEPVMTRKPRHTKQEQQAHDNATDEGMIDRRSKDPAPPVSPPPETPAESGRTRQASSST